RPRAARYRHALHVGLQDGSLRHRSRSDTLQRLRRGARCDGAGGVLLASAGTDRPRHRLGHSLPARVRVGVFPGAGAHRRGVDARDGGNMSRYVFKLPDLGEGTVEAEIVGWRVKPGDEVSEDDVLVEVMTEKAAVEVPAPVTGKVVSTTGQAGDMVAVGAELVVLETASSTAPAGAVAQAAGTAPAAAPQAATPSATAPAAIAANGGGPNGVQSRQEKRPVAAFGNGAARQSAPAASVDGGGAAETSAADSNRRVLTSPAIRRRAKEAGIDLRQVAGSGPQGRIGRQDFEHT